MTLPRIPEVIPVDWNGPNHGIRLSLAPVDEFDMPRERRGFRADIPASPTDYAHFADEIAAAVRATVLFILTGEAPKEASA